jgi:hypothetical protein
MLPGSVSADSRSFDALVFVDALLTVCVKSITTWTIASKSEQKGLSKLVSCVHIKRLCWSMKLFLFQQLTIN